MLPSNTTALIDGSFESFLCVVHAHFYDKLNPDIITTPDSYQKTLDTEYITVDTDADKAKKVYASLAAKISPDASNAVYTAFLTPHDEKYIDIYNYILLGYRVGANVDAHMQHDCVMRVKHYVRQVGREAHLLKGFCRFAETKSGVFYCAVTPDNLVLPMLAEHFADRLMNQQWIIHDKKRNIAAIYDGNDYEFVEVPNKTEVLHSDNEEYYQRLWKAFHDAIGILPRKNYKLQRQMLPLKFRGNMVEFVR